MPSAPRREPIALAAITLVLLAVSALAPHDRFTWFMEIVPILVALPVVAFTYRTFPLTPLVYRLLAVHAVILMVGGHYTYANVPFGFWLRDVLHLARNPYDRIGHFAQGFVPAIVVREILLRRTPLRAPGWIFFLVTCVCLSFSACYEFFEWWTAVGTGTRADAFLGTQGDPWDTQWDMFTAFLAAMIAQLTLARVHDHQLARETPAPTALATAA